MDIHTSRWPPSTIMLNNPSAWGESGCSAASRSVYDDEEEEDDGGGVEVTEDILLSSAPCCSYVCTSYHGEKESNGQTIILLGREWNVVDDIFWDCWIHIPYRIDPSYLWLEAQCLHGIYLTLCHRPRLNMWVRVDDVDRLPKQKGTLRLQIN